MRPSEPFVTAAILDGGAGATKETLIGELLLRLAADGHLPPGDVPAVCDAVMRRERLATTGIGAGVAVPHARTDAVARRLGILAVCRTPVPFDSIDGEPADIFALMLAPYLRPGDPMPKPMHGLMRHLGDASFAMKLRAASSEADILDLLRATDGLQ